MDYLYEDRLPCVLLEPTKPNMTDHLRIVIRLQCLTYWKEGYLTIPYIREKTVYNDYTKYLITLRLKPSI